MWKNLKKWGRVWKLRSEQRGEGGRVRSQDDGEMQKRDRIGGGILVK